MKLHTCTWVRKEAIICFGKAVTYAQFRKMETITQLQKNATKDVTMQKSRRMQLMVLTQNVGRGGALVESKPFDRMVVGSNPALAAMQGPWASPQLAVACGASA